MRKLTFGLVLLITAVVLTAGAAAAHGATGATADETPMNAQQEECEAMMGEIDDCPMADGGVMGMTGMMHGDGIEECQEMMDEDMMDEMMEECQEMMGGDGMMGMMNGGMMDGGMDNMMNGDGSRIGCH